MGLTRCAFDHGKTRWVRCTTTLFNLFAISKNHSRGQQRGALVWTTSPDGKGRQLLAPASTMTAGRGDPPAAIGLYRIKMAYTSEVSALPGRGAWPRT